MSDLLREVDEAVRADNMKRFWDEHKIAVISAITALIVGTAAYSIWTNMKLKQNRNATTQVLTALESGNPVLALKEAGAEQKGNAAAIAYLNAASLELKAGNKNQALDAFIQAENAKQADKNLRDFAVLQKTGLLMDLKPEMKAEDLLASLSAVSESDKSPWQAEAIFMSALIKGEKSNDYASAIKDLDVIAARTDIPGSLKQRAEALQSVYTMKQQVK